MSNYTTVAQTYDNETSTFDLLQGSSKSGVHKIISDYAASVWSVILICGFYEVIGFFGAVSNAINIYVFIKLGFQDTINVTLLALTVSDLGSLLLLCWMGICYNPLFINSDVHFDTLSVVFLTGGRVKLCFSRISSMITSYAALERCLCIILPFKIKTILTPKRAAYICTAIYITSIVTIAPLYATSYLDWKWYPDRNKTLLGLYFSKDRFEIIDIVHGINQFFTIGSYLLIVIFAIIIVISLERQRQKVKGLSISEQTNANSTRNSRVSKLVLLISVTFIVCFLPGNAASFTMIFEPKFNKNRAYNNLFTVVWAFCHILEGINASVNIFIYLTMSSRYKNICRTVFCPKKNLHDDTDTHKTQPGSSGPI